MTEAARKLTQEPKPDLLTIKRKETSEETRIRGTACLLQRREERPELHYYSR